ncbi:DUF4145 domain-containing protein [Mycobacterium sp. 20091114027_K0903767]|nr:DUF4145 domain-containing protein [Mycobacterium sp. 20091114027_K0903767]
MCKAYTQHTIIGTPTVVGHQKDPRVDGDLRRISAVFECAICAGHSIGVGIASRYDIPGDRAAFYSEANHDNIIWRPELGDTKAYADVPEHIAEAATEAYECAGYKHNRAAILLARAVIEATAKAKKIEKGTLYDKIEELCKQGFIRQYVKEAAHGVRALGNDMAHGDFVEPISTEDTTLVIELMGEILDEVFQSPARVARVQAAAGARKQPSN